MNEDLNGVVKALEGIRRAVDKPFQDMDEKQNHEEILNANKEMVKWTMILSIATALMALGTFILVFLTAKFQNIF